MIPAKDVTVAELKRRMTNHGKKSNQNFVKYQHYIWEDCYQFARMYCRKSKIMTSSGLSDDFIMYLAEELFVMLKNHKVIEYWWEYLNKCIFAIIDDFYVLNGQDMKYRKLKEKPYDPAAGKRYSVIDVEYEEDKAFIAQTIEELFSKISAFFARGGGGSYQWTSKEVTTNAHISILLSLKYHKFISFRLCAKDASIVRLLYNQIQISFAELLSERDRPKISEDEYRKILIDEIEKSNLLTYEDDEEEY